MTASWISALFHPKRVALFGATEGEGKVGQVFMKNLIDDATGFKGDIIPVHPGADQVFGIPACKQLTDYGDTVDLAIIVTPAPTIPSILEDCANAKVPLAVIITGGFAELGAEGEKLQSEIADISRKSGIRIIGPNCFGVVGTETRLNASMGLGLPAKGGVSLVTQSGSYGMAAFNKEDNANTGYSKIIALGNKADLDETDILAALGDDPETEVIALLLESIKSGRAFFETARAITPTKPVIVLKTGRSRSAQRAAASHTAAMINDHLISAAALKQAGVNIVSDGQTLLEAAAAMSMQGGITGSRVGIITNSGGTGVELTDLLEEGGMTVPEFSPELQRQIMEHLPSNGSSGNPVDVTTQWSRFTEMYGAITRLLLECNEVDVIVPVLLQRSALMSDVSQKIIEELKTAREKGNNKPVHICWVAPESADENRAALNAAGIPTHNWPVGTARNLNACMAHPVCKEKVGDSKRWTEPETENPGWMDMGAAMSWLDANGFPVASWRMEENDADVLRSASELDYPIVLKAAQPDLLHKSDKGGVILNCKQDEDVKTALSNLRTNFGPGPIFVQAQHAPGVELFIGGMRDPYFGPVISFGLGGIWVEALKDTALRLAPFGEDEARTMLKEIRGSTILDGKRGRLAVDKTILASFVADLSQWFAARPEIEEFDINPAHAVGEKITVLDARIRLNRNTTLSMSSHGSSSEACDQTSRHSSQT